MTAESALATLNSPEWAAQNHRRAELIHKKNRDGLTDAERVEFEELQTMARELVETAHPLPEIGPIPGSQE
jgi:predicted phage gp36 major capsid-like protein